MSERKMTAQEIETASVAYDVACDLLNVNASEVMRTPSQEQSEQIAEWCSICPRLSGCEKETDEEKCDCILSVCRDIQKKYFIEARI